MRPFAKTLALAGAAIGLARTVLKCTLPGVPDTYQGTGSWDFSLVDPDNRRPVDYEARTRSLTAEAPVSDLLTSWTDGRIKQSVLKRLLDDRAGTPELYADGDYSPLHASGTDSDDVVAFARAAAGHELAVAVARPKAEFAAAGRFPIGDAWTEGGTLGVASGSWRDVLTGRVHESGSGGLSIRELFRDLPVAVLRKTG